MSKQSDTFLSNALATIAPGVNRNVIARTKPNPNPNLITYPILNLKVNHYKSQAFPTGDIVTGANVGSPKVHIQTCCSVE